MKSGNDRRKYKRERVVQCEVPQSIIDDGEARTEYFDKEFHLQNSRRMGSTLIRT